MPFDRDRQDSRGGRPRGRRKKVCSFCVDRIDHIDYKDIPRLAQVHFRAREDHSPPRYRYLRFPSA